MSTQPKTIVITGASSGLGFAIAEAFLKRGDNVVGNARTLERLQAAAAKLGHPANFLAVEGDIADPATATRLFEKAIAKFGHVDVLVNNAGIFNAKPFADYTVQELDDQIDTNLRGFVYPSQVAAAHMAARKQGHIITITAALAMQPLSNVPATLPVLIKGGLNQATKSLALELAPYNVKVSAVAPGVIDTPMHSPETHAFLNTVQPMGRMGTAKDVADAVLYLSDADYITGVVLPVDGGTTAGKW
jgi:NAD(P)-dependent dehydrogenase (short-subunit alcohol dehydrogenase family)